MALCQNRGELLARRFMAFPFQTIPDRQELLGRVPNGNQNSGVFRIHLQHLAFFRWSTAIICNYLLWNALHAPGVFSPVKRIPRNVSLQETKSHGAGGRNNFGTLMGPHGWPQGHWWVCWCRRRFARKQTRTLPHGVWIGFRMPRRGQQRHWRILEDDERRWGTMQDSLVGIGFGYLL